VLDVNVRKRLGSFQLDAVFAARGSVTALVGPSGSGKTLTLRAIAGAIEPDEGRIRLGDELLLDVHRGIILPPQARRVGYVPQQYALFPHLTVAQNIGFGLTGLPRGDRENRVQDLLQLIELAPAANLKPRQLSGGQQQRVALARALAVQPRLLLLDEPFAALDTLIRQELRERLRELQKELGFWALIVTHDPEDAAVLATESFQFDQGRVIQVA
jgi:ABC-type sulfate/molybdate transport systems ATPase subunit